MPFYLEDAESISEVFDSRSVLIVPCRFCPAASKAVRLNEPYFDFLKGFLKTPAYENHIQTLKSELELKGIKTDVVNNISPHHFTMCMWTDKQRKKLFDRAKKYEAILVLGCDAAVQTISDAVKSASCKVVQGMTTQWLMSVKPKFQFPGKVLLELNSTTPIFLASNGADDPPVKQTENKRRVRAV